MAPDDLLVFAAVARAGGVRRGALALGIPRSTVSQKLADLEKALGGQLVTRSSRSFAVTELGEALLPKCEELEALLESATELADRSAREPEGTLRVSASPVWGEDFLPPVISKYLRRFPRMRLEVRLSSEVVDLRRGSFDVAIHAAPLQAAAGLYAVRLATSSKGYFASPKYLDAHGTPESPDELSGHACILLGPASQTWTFPSRAGELAVRVAGSLRVDSHHLARAAAADGLGIARLPEVFARSFVRDRRLVPVLDAHWPKTELFAVHAYKPTPRKVRAFIEIVKDQMRR